MKLMRFWEMFTQKPNNFLPIFIETLRLNGGLKHLIFFFLVLVLFVTVDVFCCFWNVILCLNPLSANALLYKSSDLLKVVSFADKVLILLHLLPGRLLIYLKDILKGSYQHNNLVYSCEVSTPNLKQNHPHYIGLTENTFKDRLYKHSNSFMCESKRNQQNILSSYGVKRKRRLMWILIRAF